MSNISPGPVNSGIGPRRPTCSRSHMTLGPWRVAVASTCRSRCRGTSSLLREVAAYRDIGAGSRSAGLVKSVVSNRSGGLGHAFHGAMKDPSSREGSSVNWPSSGRDVLAILDFGQVHHMQVRPGPGRRAYGLAAPTPVGGGLVGGSRWRLGRRGGAATLMMVRGFDGGTALGHHLRSWYRSPPFGVCMRWCLISCTVSSVSRAAEAPCGFLGCAPLVGTAVGRDAL